MSTALDLVRERTALYMDTLDWRGKLTVKLAPL